MSHFLNVYKTLFIQSERKKIRSASESDRLTNRRDNEMFRGLAPKKFNDDLPDD